MKDSFINVIRRYSEGEAGCFTEGSKGASLLIPVCRGCYRPQIGPTPFAVLALDPSLEQDQSPVHRGCRLDVASRVEVQE